MRSLGVECKVCGQTFSTGMLVPSYGRPVFAGLPCTCPACRTVATYASADFTEIAG